MKTNKLYQYMTSGSLDAHLTGAAELTVTHTIPHAEEQHASMVALWATVPRPAADTALYIQHHKMVNFCAVGNMLWGKWLNYYVKSNLK